MNLQHISYNIKFFREQAGWTQAELANKIIGSRSTIAKWENNTLTPDITSLIKLSDIFDVTLDHLVGRQSFKKELLKDFKRIYQLDSESYDENITELVEYIMTYPKLHKSIFQLKKLSLQKQLSIHQLIESMITEYEKI